MKQFYFSAAKGSRSEKLSLRYIVPPILVGTMLFFCLSGMDDVAETHGSHEMSLDEAARLMPDGADDIKYYFSPTFTAFEFNIDEEGFRHWATAWSLHEITAPVKIKRHNYMGDATNPAAGPDEITVSFGLTDGAMSSNGTGKMVLFDRNAKRAYYLNIP